MFSRRLTSIRHDLRILRRSAVHCQDNEVRGKLRAQGRGLRTGLTRLRVGVSLQGSSAVSFHSVNVSRVFMSRYRYCGGLVFRAHRAEMTNVNGTRNSRETVGLLFTVQSVRHHAKGSLKTAFLSNAIIIGTLARLCIVFGCLHPERLGQRRMDYFST